MGQSVSFIKLIKLLNEAPDLTLKFNLLKSALELETADLIALANEVNDYSDLIEIKSDELTLKSKVDLFDDLSIFKRVSGSGRIAILDKIDSTNSYMIKNARNLASGDVVIAEVQNSGRGRRGGKWHSTFGKQITLSVCYVFDSIEKLQGLSVGIGVAVAQSIEKFGFEDILLKWPNDVYKDHKKVGGILIETVPYKQKIKAIIGVGLNVYADQFGKLDREYTSIFETKEDTFKRNDLAVALINNIKRTCNEFNTDHSQRFIEAFKARDELLGKNINVETVQGIYSGRAAGIDKKGALLLSSGDSIMSITSGHITFIVNTRDPSEE